MSDDHCIFGGDGFLCERCGVTSKINLPMDIKAFAEVTKKFCVQHVNCKEDLRMVKFTGHSDDIINVEGRVFDEFYVKDLGEISYGVIDIGGKMRVHAIYDGCWSFAVGQVEEDKPLPDWPVRHMGSSGYTAVLEIDIPKGVMLIQRKEEE